MPLYQLPTGKVVYVSIEQLLNMEDEDEQYLISTGQGADPRNPFFGSTLNGKSHDSDTYESDGLDYEPDEDEPDTTGPIDLNNIPDEDTLSD